MRNRLFKLLALVMALSLASGGTSAALGQGACVHHSSASETHDTHATHDAAAGFGDHASHADASGSARSGNSDSPESGDDHSGGCSCLGQCLGGTAPLAVANEQMPRTPSITCHDGTHELSDAESLRSQPPFLLPFANAPPAAS